MSPFLAEVNIVNLAGDARSSTAPGQPGDALAELRASVEQLKANIKDEVAGTSGKARQSAAKIKESDDDSDGAESVTVNNGNKSIVVHHGKSKSSDGDTVFAAIPIVAIVFTFLYLIVRALMAPFTNRAKRGASSPVVMEGLSAEDAAILEKLQRTLARMESRVESLETILIDPTTHPKEKYGSKL